jgi:hypothetical protein
VRLGDADDDMSPCPQINLDSQSFEGFLLQDFRQFIARPIFVERFVGTKDISMIQDLVHLANDFGGFDDSGGSIFDSSSTDLL